MFASTRSLLALSFALFLAPAAASAQLSANGPGSAIPGTGTGGGGTWDTAQPASSIPSAVNLATPVTRVNSIVVRGLTHSFIGDVQMTLRDPNGVEHNIFVRPGMDNGNPNGQAGDMLLGDWTFVQCGGMDLPDCGFTVCGNNDVPSGTYNQTFFTGANLWTDGNSNIFNTDMCSISGPAGDWSLVIYDWAGLDPGAFTGWTLNYNGPTCLTTCGTDPFPSLCNGDGGDQMGCTDCPCGNNAAAGTVGGCINSAGTSTRISAGGDPSVSLPSGDSTDLRFTLSGAPPTSTCVLLSGAAVAPTNMANPCFGSNSGALSVDRDGLRCAVQSLLRHGNRQSNASGEIMDSTGPNRVWGGEAQPTDGIAGQSGFVSGQTRIFQVTHRDDAAAVCMRGLNTSQAVSVKFTP